MTTQTETSQTLLAPEAPRESMKTRLMRWAANFWPVIWGTGGRITFVAHDLRELRIKLPLNWLNRNYIGTLFGGSLFAITDPMYMIMLIHLLGPKYFVVDKAGTIRFLKPGRSTLFATFRIPEEETTAIRQALEHQEMLDRVYTVNLVDAQGVVHATVERTVHIRKRRPAGNKTAPPAV
ncbi:MAG: DUF4442 domain-containing protein [Deltaproteobacteria bacterium]|nr:DUF4442 domain-containing protein [Deltaproteobacteria bacterium]